jgi:hypothetical protein
MAEHPEKRMETIAFKTTDKVKRALAGLCQLDDVSQSEYLHDLALLHVEKKESELILLCEALGKKIS